MTDKEKQADLMRKQEMLRRKEQDKAEGRQKLHMQQMQAQAMRQQTQSQSGISPQVISQMIGNSGNGSASAASSSMTASAAPAAIAAAVVANEYFATKDGRRSSNIGQSMWDGLTGKNMSKDLDYYGDKVGGPGGKLLNAASNVSRLDKPLGKDPEDLLKFWEWF